ncbi:hypothetical protein F8388_021263 [Cannabis sativa]|uniref:Uncharacterized protein n=1 Tax=Cannabis sativa TaxID=3483 RepID=A0A7J6GFB2_CANSA|nr:hypothetical protein F8388_021263 [Cannabis sativa]
MAGLVAKKLSLSSRALCQMSVVLVRRERDKHDQMTNSLSKDAIETPHLNFRHRHPAANNISNNNFRNLRGRCIRPVYSFALTRAYGGHLVRSHVPGNRHLGDLCMSESLQEIETPANDFLNTWRYDFNLVMENFKHNATVSLYLQIFHTLVHSNFKAMTQSCQLCCNYVITIGQGLCTTSFEYTILITKNETQTSSPRLSVRNHTSKVESP